MKLIRLLFQQSGRMLTLAAIASLLGGSSSAGLIATINLALQGHPPSWLLGAFFGLCGTLLLGTATSLILMNRLSQTIIFNLRMDLSERILASPLQHLETLGAPKLLAALTEDVEAIADASVFASALCVNSALILGCFVYLFWLSVPVFLLLLAFGLLEIWAYLGVTRRGRQAMRQARQSQDRLFANFQAATQGTKELKLHRQRRLAFLGEELRSSAAAVRHYWTRAMGTFALAQSIGLVLIFIPIGLLLFVVPHIAQLSLPIISSYALTILFLITPIQALLSSFPRLSRANIALEQLEALGLSLARGVRESDELRVPVLPQWSKLELVGITHAYPSEVCDTPFNLGPIDLTLVPGELVFVVGGNGSGKSTLVKVLAGLYAPEAGEIYLDGVEITDDCLEGYRQQFSVVFADFYLFDRLLGLEETEAELTQTYLERLQLDGKVRLENGRLSTTHLSQGQRKRLALLTAYLEDRPIYIFDEWASDQDPTFKEIFYRQLLPELKQRGKTILVVTHDDRYFGACDRIIKLEYGRVASDRQRQSQ